MNIFGFDFPNILLKFCEKEDYAKDIVNGKIYMKESAFFRKLDNNFRGDKFDGRCPVDLKGEKIILKAEGEEPLEFPFVSDFSFGFLSDDKIPVFCATLLTEDILEKISPTEFRFKFAFVKEMTQFGKYIVWLNLDEFWDKVKQYVEKNSLGAKAARVRYVDIGSEYSLEDFEHYNKEPYSHLFKKDFTYQWQNEWRLLLIAENYLIDENKDYYIMELGSMEYSHILDAEMLTTSNIQIKEK